MIDFEDKVALVTGASRGIGHATAKAMASAGARVVLHYGSNIAAAQKTADDVGSDRSILVQADLTQPGAAKQLWAQAFGWRERIDILVNNAGIAPGVHVDDSDADWEDNWRTTLQVNLVACADLCRCAVNTWHRAGTGGSIVNVASRAAFRGDGPDYWSYAASKGGVVSLTKTIARAYAADGIYAYGIAPGWVATDMALEAIERDPDAREVMVRDIPMGDIAPPEDIAHTICFLASGLAPNATGATIDINGASYVR